MKNIWKILYHMSGEIYIPEEAMDTSIKILHISDTPSMIYRKLVKLAKKIRPDILIHTGDVADDVKLEMLPQHIVKYKARAEGFLHVIRPYVKDRLIVVPGNHDSVEVLNSVRGIEIMDEGSILDTLGVKIGLSHKPDNLPEACDYYMYGHCRTDNNNPRYLNGIDRISIVRTGDGEVIRLLYPAGTDDYRFRRSKIGI